MPFPYSRVLYFIELKTAITICRSPSLPPSTSILLKTFEALAWRERDRFQGSSGILSIGFFTDVSSAKLVNKSKAVKSG